MKVIVLLSLLVVVFHLIGCNTEKTESMPASDETVLLPSMHYYYNQEFQRTVLTSYITVNGKPVEHGRKITLRADDSAVEEIYAYGRLVRRHRFSLQQHRIPFEELKDETL